MTNRLKASRKRPGLGPPCGSSIKFAPVLGNEVTVTGNESQETKRVKYLSITMMDAFINKSIEELRLEDYNGGRKNPQTTLPTEETPHLKTMMEYNGSLLRTYGTYNDEEMTEGGNTCSDDPCSLKQLLNASWWGTTVSMDEDAIKPSLSPNVTCDSSETVPFGRRQFNGSINNMTECVDAIQNMCVGSDSTAYGISTMSSTGLVPIIRSRDTAGLYPVFSNGKLVAYTTEELKTNPICVVLPGAMIQRCGTCDAATSTHDTPWNELRTFLENSECSLYPTPKPGEFMVDESPARKKTGSMILESYDKIWNSASTEWTNYFDNSAGLNGLGIYESKNLNDPLALGTFKTQNSHSSEPKFSSFDQNIHLHCQFIQSKLAYKRRRRLLQTDKIFSNAPPGKHSFANEKFTLFPQNEESHLPTAVVTESVKATGDSCLISSTRPRVGYKAWVPTHIVAPSKSMTDEARLERDDGESGKDSTEDLSLALKQRWDGRSNRSRRPRSKSLSVRPKGRTCGVRLTRERYYCIPSVQTLDTMVGENGQCIVENFQIGHLDYGYLVFEGKVDVAGVNLDEIVVFNLKEMFLYPSTDSDCGKENRQLDKPALVTLFQVWPQRIETGEFIRDVNAINAINYEYLLRKTCERMEVQFVSYDPYVGHWKFRLPNRVEESKDDSK